MSPGHDRNFNFKRLGEVPLKSSDKQAMGESDEKKKTDDLSIYFF